MVKYCVATDGSGPPTNIRYTRRAGIGIVIRTEEYNDLTPEYIEECKLMFEKLNNHIPDATMCNLLQSNFNMGKYSAMRDVIKQLISKADADISTCLDISVYHPTKPRAIWSKVVGSAVGLRTIDKILDRMKITEKYQCYHAKQPLQFVSSISIESMTGRIDKANSRTFNEINLSFIENTQMAMVSKNEVAGGTNQRSELGALIVALYLMRDDKYKVGHIEFICDSKYVIDGFGEKPNRINANADLWMLAHEVHKEFIIKGWTISFVWQKGHKDKSSIDRMESKDKLRAVMNNMADAYSKYTL